MKIVLQNVLWLLIFVAYQYFCLAKESATIGVFFAEEKNHSEIVLNSTLYIKNTVDQVVYFGSNIKRISRFDSFEASKVLCKVMEEGVTAILGVDAPTSTILESICAHFDIPYLSTSMGPPLTKAEGTVINLFPKADLFARALAEVVRSLHWNSFVIIYEEEEGLIRMQEILKLQQLKEDPEKRNNILVKQLGPGNDHRTLLKEIKNATENNIILDCKTENIISILKQAKDQNLLQLNNNYFLTSLDAHTLDFSTLDKVVLANITTIRLFDQNDEIFIKILNHWELMMNNFYGEKKTDVLGPIKTETVLFYDALRLLTNSINEISNTQDIITNPVYCSEDSKSKIGHTLSVYMKQKTPQPTLSGPIKFDEFGNREEFIIDVVDIVNNKLIAKWIQENTTLVLSRSQNETDLAYDETLKKVLVNVTTRIGEPYVMIKTAENGQILTGNARFEGYAIDLIDKIAKIIGFEYQFILTEDKEYGKYDDKQRRWTGLIGDLLEGRAQLAICDLTITHQRRDAVDFSLPFMTLGISILYRVDDKKDINMFAFLDPFGMSVWIYTATLYLIISVVLYFISRMTPGDWENPHPCDENPEELENIWDIKNCLWLTLGSIMTQGCDILPKGISSRMAVSMWWFFSLIMTSSYTANLAAFLTKDRMEPSIDGAEALSKQNKIKYGALEGGATYAFFKDTNFSTYERMWISMSSNRDVFVKDNKEGVKKVQSSKGNYAFLMESTQIEYEIQTKCNLKQVGQPLDTKGYGIAMPMNSGYRTSINKAILQLQESGALGDLKKKWWKIDDKEYRKKKNCPNDEDNDENSDGSDLALANVGGVFYVLGIGIAIAIALAICEFLWNVRSVSVEEHMTYWEALKVEFKFACNVWITKKRTKPAVSESSSSGSRRSDKIDNKSMMHSIMHSAGSFMNIRN